MLIATNTVFAQLIAVLEDIQAEDYQKQSTVLSGATIGQHMRHIIEFYQCLVEACADGALNYDNRKRTLAFETFPAQAIQEINNIKDYLEQSYISKGLLMEVDYSSEMDSEKQFVKTSLQRELVYNIEHAVHHMAIIKIGIKEVAPYLNLPAGFGVAVSTLKYQRQCAP